MRICLGFPQIRRENPQISFQEYEKTSCIYVTLLLLYKSCFYSKYFSGGASKWQNANSAKRAYPLVLQFLTLTDVPTALGSPM
jgi:hypothetical protein